MKDTLAARGNGRVSTQIVTIDIATGARKVHASGPALNLSPRFVGLDCIAYLAKSGRAATLTFTTGEKGAAEDIANPA